MRELAFRLYLVFVVSWFLHLPQRLAVLAVLRIDLLLILIIAALTAMSASSGPSPLSTRTSKIVVGLVLYVVATVPFVEWPGTALKLGMPLLIKALVFFYFTATLVTTEQKLKLFLMVFVACQSFRVIEPAYLHVTQGYWGSGASMANWETMYRLSGAPADIINPNGLAFVILTVIPFAHYLLTPTKLGKGIYLALLSVLLYALVLTGSRSGMVGLVATYGAIWFRSRHKMVMTAMAAVAVVIAVTYMSADMVDRYRSLVDPNTKNAGTASGRIEGVHADFLVAMRRPFFGHGLGASLEANFHYGGRAQPSHNLYTEVLQELGFFGLAIFLCLLWSIVRNSRLALRTLAASKSPSPLLVRTCRALEAFLAMNLLFSLASYGLTSYEWYLLAGLSAIVIHLLATSTVTQPVPDPSKVSFGRVPTWRDQVQALRPPTRPV